MIGRVDKSTLPLRSSQGNKLELIVCEGPTLRRVALEDEVTIGRGDNASVRVTSAAVSRVHARVRPGPPATVEHLGSVNPTLVNGKKLESGEVVEIDRDAVIVVGDVQVILRAAHAPELPAPSVPERSMERVMSLVELAAPSELSLLVLGETGVGKEMVARKIHERSPRNKHPMLAINCAALHEATLESELFGHEKGAFTGATQQKIGLLEAASGSTLLLDEVGELPLATQAKLLRALDAREIIRVGAIEPRAIDVRIIAATHRDLAKMIEEESFRSDLYFRLDGLTIHIPPLRERKAEILILAREFLKSACATAGRAPRALTAEVEAALRSYEWPGNVRELKKVIERAVVLAGSGEISVAHLQFKSKAPSAAPETSFKTEREVAEKRAIERALEQCGGNQTRAAAHLGISRRTLVDRLGRYGIKRGDKP